MTALAEPGAYQAIIILTDAGFTGTSVTADYREDHRPGPDSNVWTFHAFRPR